MNPDTVFLALNLALSLIQFAEKARVDLSQSGELTSEQEAALDAKIADLKSRPHWQPES